MKQVGYTFAAKLRGTEVVAADAVTDDAVGLPPAVCLRQEAACAVEPLLGRHALVAAAPTF